MEINVIIMINVLSQLLIKIGGFLIPHLFIKGGSFPFGYPLETKGVL